jgi:phosphoribosylformimino-5-aminoimidazole carboxamide ribotide isomerase
LMHGQVVRGLAGQRQHYQPIRSPLVTDPSPLAVARAFRNHFGLDEIYLADLDAIAGSPPASNTFAALEADGFRLWIDAGLRTSESAQPLLSGGNRVLVAGLETLGSPQTLVDLLEQAGAGRVVFSLDLKNSEPLATSRAWNHHDPWGIACEAILLGVRRLLVLDLARVGMSAGTGTEPLCARLKAAHPEVMVLAGGGIRGRDDVLRLRQSGVDGVLVASALHDGALSREDVGNLQQ